MQQLMEHRKLLRRPAKRGEHDGEVACDDRVWRDRVRCRGRHADRQPHRQRQQRRRRVAGSRVFRVRLRHIVIYTL